MPSLTLTLDTANAARVATMVQRRMNLDHPADINEVKAYIIQRLRAAVLDSERAAAQEAANANQPINIT